MSTQYAHHAHPPISLNYARKPRLTSDVNIWGIEKLRMVRMAVAEPDGSLQVCLGTPTPVLLPDPYAVQEGRKA